MSFDPTVVLDIVPVRTDAELRLTWFTAAPAGTWFQVYLSRSLVWAGKGTTATIPYPSSASGRSQEIDVGAVLSSEIHTDFSASLPIPAGGGGRILLSWQGGTFESLTIKGFHVYIGLTPAGPVNYTTPAATIAAYLANIVTDGYGIGGYGQGSYGHAAGKYSWTSQYLATGVWNVAVRPFDAAGNEGTGTTGTVVVSGPPRPPARAADGNRLHYRFLRQAAVVGGYGLGGYGSGGYGTGAGYGSGGYGLGGYGIGTGDGLSYIELYWLASPGY